MKRFVFIVMLVIISVTKCFSQGYFGVYNYFPSSSQGEELKETNGRISFGESNFGTEEDPEIVGVISVQDIDDDSGIIDQQFFFGQNALYSYKKEGYLKWDDVYSQESIRIFSDRKKKNYVQIEQSQGFKSNKLDKNIFLIISFFEEGDQISFMSMDLSLRFHNEDDFYKTVWNFIKNNNIKETAWE